MTIKEKRLMSFDMNPADEDPHGECRHEIERLNKQVQELTALN